MKKIFITLLSLILMLGIVMSLAACNNGNEGGNNTDGGGEGNDDQQITNKDYKVTLIDALGGPIANVIVEFKNADGASKKFVTDKTGVATYKNAPAVDYTVTLTPGPTSTAIIPDETYTLDKTNSELRLILRNGESTMDIYGSVPDNSYAYVVGEGEYSLLTSPGDMTYFVFMPRTSGVYEVYFTSDDAEMTVGYYGSYMYVLANHISDDGDEEYDGKSFSLTVQEAGVPYTVGVKSVTAESFKLTIERTGDAPFDPHFAPWTVISATAELTKCELPDGAVLRDIDVTDPNLSVTLGEDGIYYTADGKPVYIRITSAAPYLGASLALLAGFESDNVGINIGGYIYDDDGNFVAKVSYNTMIQTYMEYCDDEEGVCLLTEELAEAIKLHGENSGWWTLGTVNYLFTGMNIVKDNAWLFICCTAE